MEYVENNDLLGGYQWALKKPEDVKITPSHLKGYVLYGKQRHKRLVP